MAVFIDTGVFVALRNADDELHLKSKELMRKALKAEFGKIYTSDYIIDEAVTLALVRTRRLELAIDIGKFKSFEDKPLSFTDCTTLAHMEKARIKQIISFDSDFDGLVQRIY